MTGADSVLVKLVDKNFFQVIDKMYKDTES